MTMADEDKNLSPEVPLATELRIQEHLDVSSSIPKIENKNESKKSLNKDDGGVLFERGEECLASFQQDGNPIDLEKSIKYKNESIMHTPEKHPQFPYRLASLGYSYYTRFKHSNNLDDLDKAIKYQLQAHQLIPDGDPELPLLLHCLGESYGIRFDHLGDLRDLESFTEFLTRAVSLTPEKDPTLPVRLSDLGVSYVSRFQRWGCLDDIEQATEWISRAISLTSEGDPDLAVRLDNLGACYNMHFGAVGNIEDLDKAINYGLRSCSLRPEGQSDAYQLGNLGAAYSSRFHRLGNVDDLSNAIECELKSCSLTPEGDLILPTRLENLSDSFLSRFQRLDDLSDLEKAIKYALQSHSLSPRGQANAFQLSKLGSAFSSRFSRLCDPSDQEKAIEYKLQALSLTPNDHPSLSSRLGSLASSYEIRFERLGDLNDLDQAIEIRLRVYSLTPKGHPELPIRLSNLAYCFRLQFQRFGNMDSLEKAIEYQLHAHSLTPKDHPDLPARLGDLGSSYFARFQRLGNLRDLDMGIEHRLQALSMTPHGHPDKARYTNGLGSSYETRFWHLLDPGDLEIALKYRLETCELTPEGHPALASRLGNLGASYETRFKRLGNLDDLQNAIKYKLQAYSLTPEGNPWVPFRLGLLGVSYFTLFKRSGEPGDLAKAIEYRLQAYSLTPKGHPELPIHLGHLGDSYAMQFQSQGDLDDLNKAIEYKLRAQSLISEEHSEFPQCMRSLGLSYWQKSRSLSDPKYLTQAKHCFMRAACASIGHPIVHFDSARYWARAAVELGDNDHLSAYRTAIGLMSEAAWFGTTTILRYDRLGQLGDIALEAAAAALDSSCPELALEWLEQGRSIVWSQTLRFRSPLDHLHASHPDLADEIRAISIQLQNSGSYDLGTQDKHSDLESVIQQHHMLARKYHGLIKETRELPGFSNFLKPKTVAELVAAARTGPIVIISYYNDRSDALVISPGSKQVERVPLHTFSAYKVGEMCTYLNRALSGSGMRRPIKPEDASGERLEDLLVTLWNDVVKPVFDFLRLVPDSNSDRLPHITWCTAGQLSFLPLHAAGNYSVPNENVSAYAISSYTPTLTALLSQSFQSSNAPRTFNNSSLLVVGQETTPGQTSLPGTKEELAYIRQCASSIGKYTEMVDSQARTTVVLDAMEKHDWVHLACHANQHANNPTESGFYLHDGILDLSTIMKKSFINKGLAFLSACQTAQGDEKLPDEAVHLASGLLMAGYPSVIATMWSVRDEDAPFIANGVYCQLLKNGEMHVEGAARALHNAVLELRKNIGVENYGRWAQFIHIGS
ncbi:unnamed protein product [Rhizoctonia solani]|uniref:CHAT domain-containing protein n=1 Tax=Rhizoctonia solani TaxID=456999 RepID=A0A8H3H5C2_9AGAM|nr:unnamed protein product [Rhizoctonia solani]